LHAEVVFNGEHFTVKALETESGRCYFEEFYDDLEESEKKDVDQLIKFFSNRMQVKNTEKFRKLRDKIFELKPHPARLPGFYSGKGVFIITHGFKKGEPIEQEIKKAKRLRRRYLSRR